MSEFLTFAFLGLATGSLYALLGLGMTVVYRSSNVVNFSHGGVAVVAAYIYVELARRGVSTTVAVLIGILSGFLLGLLSYGLAIRPLRDASALTKAVASLAVLVVLQSATTLRYGSEPQTVRSFLPQGSTRVLGSTVPDQDLIIFGFCLVLVGVLTWVYRRTRFGMATTAVAESEFTVSLLGRSSTSIAAVNWMIGCGLAAVAGVTIAPLAAVTPSQSFTLLIPALAAALCGQFTSFPAIFAGSLVIGIGQAELSYYSTSSSALANLVGLPEALPFLVVVAIVIIRNKALPGRDFVTSSLPNVGSGRLSRQWLVTWVIVASVMIIILPVSWALAVTTGLILAVMLLSLVVVTGYAGQLSLAQVSIAGIAVLVASRLVATYSWPMPLAALVGISATIPVALIIGLPALRTRGVMLGVVTFGLADALNATLFQRVDVNEQGLGIDVGAARFFGIPLDQTTHPRSYAVFSLILLAVAAASVANLRRSSIGNLLLAVRANERAAAAMGVRVAVAKLYAFVVSGVIAAVGGLLAAWEVPYVLLNNSYNPFQSVNLVVDGTLAGVGYVSGAVVGGQATAPGAIGGQLITDIGFGEYLSLITGALLLVSIVFNPNGLVPNTLGKLHARTARLAPALARIVPIRISRSPIDDAGIDFEAAGDGEPAVSGPASGGDQPRTTAASVRGSDRDGVTLDVRDLRVVFGATMAVDGVSFSSRGGEVVGVIGPNGSGKTTLIDAITGYVPAAGHVTLGDVDLSKRPAWARNRLGVSRSFQSLELFEELTVAENLLVGSGQLRWSSWLRCLIWPQKPRLNSAVRLAVREFGLSAELGRKPGELPYGKRRLLAICRALSTATFPKVLLLDEPAAGLSDVDRAELRRLVRRVAEHWAMVVVLVEHDIELVMDVCDRIVVLEFGAKIAEGRPAEVRAHPEVIRSYLGAPEEEGCGPREPPGPVGAAFEREPDMTEEAR